MSCIMVILTEEKTFLMFSVSNVEKKLLIICSKIHWDSAYPLHMWSDYTYFYCYPQTYLVYIHELILHHALDLFKVNFQKLEAFK